MISNNIPSKEAFVWIWLPDQIEPVVAGKVYAEANRIKFTYCRSYIERKTAIPIYDNELPLKLGEIEPAENLMIPGCIRDGLPDSWGRSVIDYILLNGSSTLSGLDEYYYMLYSGSNRIGALDFQESAKEYVPRIFHPTSLDKFLEATELVKTGNQLNPELEKILLHGSSVGGARPKMLFESDNKKYIAKFSKTTDSYNFIKAEYIAMSLARHCGLNVATVSQQPNVSGKSVLLIERFDRIKQSNGWARKSMVSARTLLGLGGLASSIGSYQGLAEIIRRKFTEPKLTLGELFSRIVFNILCGNTDDHVRNHSAFWDGKMLTLTPAYDIFPYMRAGGEKRTKLCT